MKEISRQNAIKIGTFSRRALLDVASNLGGEELAEKIKPTVLDRTTIYPEAGLSMLLSEYPDAADLIIRRGKKISRQVTLLKPFTKESRLKPEELIANYGPYKERKSIKDIFKKK